MLKNARLALPMVLLLAGCATGAKDSLSDSKEGYVSNKSVAAADWTQAETVTVTITDFEFQPAQLSFESGHAYRLHLENKGKSTHFFAAEGFFKAIVSEKLIENGVPVDHPLPKAIVLAPGETKELLFLAVQKGTYGLKCTAPFHEAMGMSGKIVIS
jgi:uncharacterized cupredoxin-like copper-binding protein